MKVLYSTICGKQIDEITGLGGEDKYLPHLLGHEGCGEVLEIGPDVVHVRPHDRVVMHWRRGNGIESTPPKYKDENDSVIGGGWVTTFNEMAVVSENRLTSVPYDTPPYVASLMGCAVTTALGLLEYEAKLRPEQSIAVAGVGGVGLNVIQGAAMMRAGMIIAIDRVRSKLTMAGAFGATHVIDTDQSDMLEAIWKIVGRRGVDVFVDCTGNPKVIDHGFMGTVAGGRMILVGQPPAGIPIVLTNARQHYCGKTLMDSQGGSINPAVDIPRYLQMYHDYRIVLKDLITHAFRLDEINEAIEVVKSGVAGRVGLELE